MVSINQKLLIFSLQKIKDFQCPHCADLVILHWGISAIASFILGPSLFPNRQLKTRTLGGIFMRVNKVAHIPNHCYNRKPFKTYNEWHNHETQSNQALELIFVFVICLVKVQCKHFKNEMPKVWIEKQKMRNSIIHHLLTHHIIQSMKKWQLAPAFHLSSVSAIQGPASS